MRGGTTLIPHLGALNYSAITGAPCEHLLTVTRFLVQA